ncbi:MAG: hypothetical protein AB8B94_05155 [Hyphomicrobiales bacterium]
MGDVSVKSMLASDDVQVVGENLISRSFGRWFARSSAADIPRPTSQERAEL